jgi:hypothetical protein
MSGPTLSSIAMFAKASNCAGLAVERSTVYLGGLDAAAVRISFDTSRTLTSQKPPPKRMN